MRLPYVVLICVLWSSGGVHVRAADPPAKKQPMQALVKAPVGKKASSSLPQNCCGAGNLAYEKPVTSKSEQHPNFRKHLTDGLLNTRWCASGSQPNEWVTVDLKEPQHVRAIRLHWEKREGIAYKYIVEASPDNTAWQRIVDASQNRKPGGMRKHQVDAPQARYLRVTFLGASKGMWGSIWELEASAGELPELAAAVTNPAASVSDVRAPPGFNVTMFGQPPEVTYPVCLTAASTGEVFVGVDEQGSLGKELGRGKVLRCIDTDGDGVADQINEFAKMDHPRGLIYDDGSLWVLHPPQLSLFRDSDGDGRADTSEVLIDGISTKEVQKRGADHTTNGIRLGIDGWIYIAVGDFGFNQAVAKDGTTLSRRGGGVVRIRPDGSNMEIFAWGLRNIVDVAVDPLMNVYTRDNTNDGGGWDIRLSHILQTGNYGYPSLYKNFSDEIMPPLADYGGGSGCGAMFFQDARWPQGFNNLLLTCDWGRSEVFSHQLPANGATFDAQQDTFLKLARPTDIDADASGRLYVSSWKNGGFKYERPDVGFVAQLTPVDFVPPPVVDVAGLSDDGLVGGLEHPSATMRIAVQREILRRDAAPRAQFVGPLVALAGAPAKPFHSRAAAIFTLGQILSAESAAALVRLAAVDDVREFAIRGLTDRVESARQAPADLLVRALADQNPRVRAAALVAVGRKYRGTGAQTGAAEARQRAADAILPLTRRAVAERKAEGDAWRQPDAQRVLPHLAVQALVEINAIGECLAALSGPDRTGALAALKSLHAPATIDGLFKVLSTSRDQELRKAIWTVLIRLYHREGDFTEDSPKWWGTRPDTTGPYYDRRKWSESARIAAALKVAIAEGDPSLTTHIRDQVTRHVLKLDGISAKRIAATKEPEKAIELPKLDPDNPDQIANIDFADVLARTLQAGGDAEAGRQLFRSQACINCHTFANGQLPKGPHLVDIGKRYKLPELVESIVDPSKKIAQGFDTWAFVLDSGKVVTGFVVLESAATVTIRQADGISRELPQAEIEERIKQPVSMMPKGIVGNLRPEQLADLIAYLRTLH